MDHDCDVAIIGGGPAGSTAACLLAKYRPGLRLLLLERERFPRDHVGESQLPLISGVLDEMGVWEAVERAGFPVKIGATYRWGRTDELWNFEFLPNGEFHPAPRPGRYEGQRRQTAFQVDRAVYDKILLDHARKLGCEVREATAVRTIKREGDRVLGLTLEDGTEVSARHYVDASGHSGLLRRAMGVETQCPTSLQNIAIWDYWRNAEWATTVGVGGTRVQVLSLPYGWIWFIPLGPERTSIGLIVPASYYRECGKRPEDLYREAVLSEPVLGPLLRKATREDRLSTTKDWSFVAFRLAGENWWLAGESAGFADPILAAGMTLAHHGARDVAYAILAEERGDYDAAWLRHFYDTTHRAQILQHIRFAEFWYTANGTFTDLKEEARRIAGEAGRTLSADEAWRWLGQGGFVDRAGGTDIGLYGLFATKQIVSSFTGDVPHYEIVGKSHFRLDVEGAERDWTAELADGRLTRRRMYRRAGKMLPVQGVVGQLVNLLKEERSFAEIANALGGAGRWEAVLKALEAMVGDGWVVARTVLGAVAVPPLEVDFSSVIRPERAAIYG